jgi:TatD DNase family protein
LSRARRASIGIQLLTGDCFEGSQQVLNIAKRYNGLYSTVGCHPCRANEMVTNVEEYISKLSNLISLNRDKVLAIGECGLDYDRLFLSSKRDQLISFPPQLELAHKFNLPLFLHSRNCHQDFIKILKNHVNNRSDSDSSKLIRGVVHSFTGTESEAL